MEFYLLTSSNFLFKECDLGQNSILNAVKLKVQKKDEIIIDNQDQENVKLLRSKPLCETLLDLQLTKEEKHMIQNSSGIFHLQMTFNLVKDLVPYSDLNLQNVAHQNTS